MEKKNELTKKQWIGYACGDLGGVMTFGLMGAVVTRYYTNVLNIDTVLLATLLLIWNIWDAVNDPLMGVLMDKMFAKNHNPRGKFRPWLLRSAPLLCITAIVFWNAPAFFDGVARIAALFIAKILYEGSYTMFNIPMGSLLSAMANNDEERASLSSARGFGSGVGSALPTIIAPVILAAVGDNAKGYGLSGLICALIGFVFCMLHYYWTEERNTEFVNKESSSDDIKFKDIFEIFRTNKAFVALCIHGVCICTMQYVGNTLSSYMYADVLGSIGLMSLSTTISIPIMLIIFIVVPNLCKKYGLLKIVRTALVSGALVYLLLFGMHMVMDVNPYVHMALASLAYGLGSVSIYMQWGLVGDCIDYNEKLTGKRTEGTIYGTFNLTRRIGQTIGNSAAVIALGLVGYNASLSTQSAMTITGIKTLCVLVPAIFLICSWLAFKFIWKAEEN